MVTIQKLRVRIQCCYCSSLRSLWIQNVFRQSYHSKYTTVYLTKYVSLIRQREQKFQPQTYIYRRQLFQEADILHCALAVQSVLATYSICVLQKDQLEFGILCILWHLAECHIACADFKTNFISGKWVFNPFLFPQKMLLLTI